jgi:hypothetical protein
MRFALIVFCLAPISLYAHSSELMNKTFSDSEPNQMRSVSSDPKSPKSSPPAEELNTNLPPDEKRARNFRMLGSIGMGFMLSGLVCTVISAPLAIRALFLHRGLNAFFGISFLTFLSGGAVIGIGYGVWQKHKKKKHLERMSVALSFNPISPGVSASIGFRF